MYSVCGGVQYCIKVKLQLPTLLGALQLSVRAAQTMDEEAEQTGCIWSAILALLLILPISTSNGFLLLVLYRDPLKCMRKPVHVFIASLAISDFMTGILSGTSIAVRELACYGGDIRHPGAIGDFAGISYFFTVSSATLLISALSIERFLAVAFPFFHRVRVTSKKAMICSAVIFTHAFVFAMLQLADLPDDVYHNMDLNLHIVFPLVTVTVAYTAIYLALRQLRKLGISREHRNSRGGLLSFQSNANVRNRQLATEMRLVWTEFFSILVCMVVALMPYYVVLTLELQCEKCKHQQWFIILRRLSVPFLFINSAVNAALYAWRIPYYRKSFKVIFPSLCHFNMTRHLKLEGDFQRQMHLSPPATVQRMVNALNIESGHTAVRMNVEEAANGPSLIEESQML